VKDNISKEIKKVIAKVALTVTKANVNSTCPYYLYQPKIPESAKKLRKF
jgi:cyclic lactone autoinducer peptide